MEIPAYHPFKSEEAKERYLKYNAVREQRWPVPSESRLVQTSYGQTFVRISGPGGAEPLVLLHGAASTSLMLVPNIEVLSRHYRTFAVDDFYGYGQSRCTKPIQNRQDLVNWLDELLTALGLGDNINLVGLSYGGWLVSQYALRYQSRLNKVILIAPAATVLPIRLAVIVRAILGALPHRYFIENFFRWMFTDLAKQDKENRLLEASVDYVLTGKQCFKLPRMVRPTLLSDAEIRSIHTPVLFLVGENEKLYSAQQAVERLNKVMPRMKAMIIPRAGHDVTMVQAQMVNKMIVEFLRQP